MRSILAMMICLMPVRAAADDEGTEDWALDNYVHVRLGIRGNAARVSFRISHHDQVEWLHNVPGVRQPDGTWLYPVPAERASGFDALLVDTTHPSVTALVNEDGAVKKVAVVTTTGGDQDGTDFYVDTSRVIDCQGPRCPAPWYSPES